MQTYHPGETVETPSGKFLVERSLSQGEMAHAYRAVELSSGEPVLFKIYSHPVPDAKYCPWYPRYRDLQTDISHRLTNIPGQALRMLAHFVHRRAYHQVIEWANGRPMDDLLPELNAEPTLEKPLLLAKVMLFTLKKVHEQGVIHCDLKPGNYFAEEDPSLKMRYRLKMADFDCSLVHGKPSPRDGALAGTFGYFSPEHLRFDMPTPASDVFTVGGIMLHELLTGKHPFEPIIAEATTGDEANTAIRAALEFGSVPPLDPASSPRLASLPSEIPEIVRRCLSWRPEDRPTAEEVHAILLGGRLSRRLVLVGGPGGVLRFRFEGETAFGRDFCKRYFGVESLAVSRSHGRFVPNADRTEWCYHPESGATNPVLVGPDVAAAPVPLEAGQTFRVGAPSGGAVAFEMRVEFE